MAEERDMNIKRRKQVERLQRFGDHMRARLVAWKPPEPRIKTGYMQRYVQLVQPALKGAVLKVR